LQLLLLKQSDTFVSQKQVKYRASFMYLFLFKNILRKIFKIKIFCYLYIKSIVYFTGAALKVMPPAYFHRNYNRYEELDSQDNSSSLDESQASQKVGQPRCKLTHVLFC